MRLRALDVALSASVPLSDDVVVTLTSDASPEVRALALEAIVSGTEPGSCLLYTSDAADERSSVDLGGRRIIKKKNYYHDNRSRSSATQYNKASPAYPASKSKTKRL